MPFPVQFPETVYDNTHTWQNANDRVAYQRSFSLDPVEAAKCVQALTMADPSVPEEFIRESMTAPVVDSRLAQLHQPPITVLDCFGPNPGGHLNDFAPTNFSGKQSQFEGTGVPSLPAW